MKEQWPEEPGCLNLPPLSCRSGATSVVFLTNCTFFSQWHFYFSSCFQLKERESEENIDSHESFHDNLLKMEQWLMIIKQKFESFHTLHGKWMVEGREHEAEVRLCRLFHFRSLSGEQSNASYPDTPGTGHHGQQHSNTFPSHSIISFGTKTYESFKAQCP